jgi:chromosome segregation ATPase
LKENFENEVKEKNEFIESATSEKNALSEQLRQAGELKQTLEAENEDLKAKLNASEVQIQQLNVQMNKFSEEMSLKNTELNDLACQLQARYESVEQTTSQQINELTEQNKSRYNKLFIFCFDVYEVFKI